MPGHRTYTLDIYPSHDLFFPFHTLDSTSKNVLQSLVSFTLHSSIFLSFEIKTLSTCLFSPFFLPPLCWIWGQDFGLELSSISSQTSAHIKWYFCCLAITFPRFTPFLMAVRPESFPFWWLFYQQEEYAVEAWYSHCHTASEGLKPVHFQCFYKSLHSLGLNAKWKCELSSAACSQLGKRSLEHEGYCRSRGV